jgi:hypothetical protein
MKTARHGRVIAELPDFAGRPCSVAVALSLLSLQRFRDTGCGA